MKKLLFLVIFIEIISILGIVGYIIVQNKKQIPPDDELNIISDSKGEFAAGHIEVIFKKGVPVSQSNALISSYNLTYQFNDLQSSVLKQSIYKVNVAEGSERSWVERFKKDSIVEGAGVDGILHVD